MKIDSGWKVTVNKYLYLLIADQNFLRFTATDMNSSLEKIVFPEDFSVLSAAVEKVISENIKDHLCAFRLKKADGEYIWLTAKMSYAGKTERDGPAVNLYISDPSETNDLRRKIETGQKMFGTYLDILHGILLSYDIKKDALEIFYYSGSRHNCMYKGTLDEWERSISKEMLDAEYVNEFSELCSDIKKGSKDFRHSIRISRVNGSDAKKELCAFRCHTITDGNNNNIVLGCIATDDPTKDKSVFVDSINDKDTMLDMLNKRSATESANRIIARSDLKKSYFIILDLDNFKSVNDTYGHTVGDEVLIKFTNIINENIGNRGIAGRMGGDEILIVTDGITEQTELRNMLRSIRTTVEWTFANDPRSLNVTCSMGVSTFPDHGKNFKELFELADKMLYLAKEKGKNRYIIYTPEIHDPILYPEQNEKNEKKKDINLQNDKVGLMYRMMDNYLIRRSYNNTTLFSEIGIAYDLDEILMIYDNSTVAFQWNPDGIVSDIKQIRFWEPTDDFSELFDKDNLLILDGLYKMGGRCPQIEKTLEEKGVKSAIIYRIIRNGRFTGYVMFAKKNQRQKWSDYEILSLSLAAKAFDLTITDNL